MLCADNMLRLFAKDSTVAEDELLKATSFETPLGDMVAVGDDSHLYLLQFMDSKKLQNTVHKLKMITRKDIIIGETSLLADLHREMTSYFKGTLKEFNIPLKFIGTDFQKECWKQLGTLKFGEKMSYSQLASRMGRAPTHSRAVGSAAGANPLVIVVPCHRLISSAGNNGGFSCGVDRKAYLINLENS